MATDSFEEFLKKKNQGEKKVDWNQRVSIWIDTVDKLYSNINTWLSPFIEQKLLKTTTKKISLNEEFIGSYEVNQLNIYLGNDIISLTPKGTLILGSFGRIDMRGPKAERLLIEQEWNDWKFVTKVNRRELWEVNAESFKSAIQDLING